MLSASFQLEQLEHVDIQSGELAAGKTLTSKLEETPKSNETWNLQAILLGLSVTYAASYTIVNESGFNFLEGQLAQLITQRGNAKGVEELVEKDEPGNFTALFEARSALASTEAAIIAVEHEIAAFEGTPALEGLHATSPLQITGRIEQAGGTVWIEGLTPSRRQIPSQTTPNVTRQGTTATGDFIETAEELVTFPIPVALTWGSNLTLSLTITGPPEPKPKQSGPSIPLPGIEFHVTIAEVAYTLEHTGPPK